MTISHRNDLQRAMAEAVESATKSARGGALNQNNLPPIRLQVVKVASEVGREGSDGSVCWGCLFVLHLMSESSLTHTHVFSRGEGGHGVTFCT